jgi:osmoprotectant transport system permease protein
MKHFFILLSILLMCIRPLKSFAQGPIVIGSSRFTESYVLAEIAAKAIENAGYPTTTRHGFGGPSVTWSALLSGAIQVMPNYTGTIQKIYFKINRSMSFEELRKQLQKVGIGITGKLGFNNTYALAMRADEAKKLGITTIEDLKKHPELEFGLTHEFFNREDGWKPLKAHYGLPHTRVKGMEHALSYEALRNGLISVMDAYATDAKIDQYNLVLLKDNLNFFPKYDGVFIYRLDLPAKAIQALEKLTGTLSDASMRKLNAFAEATKDYKEAAKAYFRKNLELESIPAAKETDLGKLTRQILIWTGQHLTLASISLLLAMLIGIPLGIRASRPDSLSHLILGISGIVQTIPSLALLALLVPLPFLGVGPLTSIVALTLYSLLPIIGNTATGLREISPSIRDSAETMGLEPRYRLLRIYLPLASPMILAGIRTSAVINVGNATLAALIGAGGLGEPIVSGLNLNDFHIILQGAIPAALLALLVQGFFTLTERLVIPRGLRLKTSSLSA